MDVWVWVIIFIAAAGVLSFNRASLLVWTIAFFGLLFLFSIFSLAGPWCLTICWLIFLVIIIPLNWIPFRQKLISKRVLSIYRRLMPSISDTEKEALAAGNVGWEGELFSGMPNWDTLNAIPKGKLSDEERAFINGPVDDLCQLLSNWQINHELYDIPDNVWDHLKKEGFFGLIIPKKYGGKEFSALAHAQIITKVATLSMAVGTVISVPNSLGPAELLLHYGTEEQKDHYLPRLAKGEEIPCFALTSPVAGSDAGAIEDYGIVCEKVIAGKKQLAISLTWSKRYITLAPIASLLGLAFKLYDPDHLLGDKEALGITCALIPVSTEGVVTGRRHYPLCSVFPNGPTQGKDVIVPLDVVIGGREGVGQGWKMLMQCLAAGRAISLPSMACGGAKLAVYTCGAYARVRRQFNTYVGSFGGVQEALTRIMANAYLMEATRLFTITAVDRGDISAVASAISKCHVTASARQVIADAMDIHGGKGICMGPNNYLAQPYIEGPISITVEGANILTRSMIIFGQGAIRSHPYVLKEIRAAECQDNDKALKDFDDALFSHLGMISSNKTRAFWLGLTGGFLMPTPDRKLKRYYRQFTRFAAAFAYISDVAMIFIGGKLKRMEKLSARLGDLLSLLYMGSAVLKFAALENNPEAHPVICWVCEDLLFKLQSQLNAFLSNMPNRWLGWGLKIAVFPLGLRIKPPSDALGHQVAELMIEPSSVRSRISQYVYAKEGNDNPIAAMGEAFRQSIAVEPLLKTINKAERKKKIFGKTFLEKVLSAVDMEVISKEEGDQLLEAHEWRMKVVDVDDFEKHAGKIT